MTEAAHLRKTGHGKPGHSRPLHVLTLTPFFPSRENEVTGCFVAEPVEQLGESGFRCSVMAVAPIHYSQRHSISSAPADWLRYPQLPGTFGLSSAGKLLAARLLGRVRRLHRAKPIDVIHAHAALPCGHAAALLGRRLQIPFVVTVHGLDVFNNCSVIFDRHSSAGISAAWRKKVSLDVYSAAHTTICISDKVQRILKNEMRSETYNTINRSTIVCNGVNPILFSPNPPREEPSDAEILVVGTLLPSKGHELVLRALANLKSVFPQLRCRIVGEGPNRDQFVALALALGIGRQVMFVGRLSRAGVAEAMRHCSIFVLPSSNEALGCVYLEAMSCAKPVIACRGQGIDEVIEHGTNGWLIPVNDAEQLSQGISALLASREMRVRIGKAARQTILERLTLSHQTAQLAAIYRQAAGVNASSALAQATHLQ